MPWLGFYLPAMAIHIPHPRKWNHKHITLVTLTGTLVVITMAAIISIVLSPAHIFFSIEKPTSDQTDEDTKYYNFTLLANNTSPHMAVVYGDLNAEIWYSETAWVPAVVNRSSLLQDDGTTAGRRKPANIGVSAEYWQSQHTSTPPAPGSSGSQSPSTDNDEMVEDYWSNCTVLVTATVWFKYGWISTRSYNVQASCSPVNFTGTGSSVPCV